MILQRLHLLHFKSIASASCTFSPKVNCFIGLNGMGKTNLLDALHYLSFTKSHLSITDSLAVQYGQEAAVLDAVYRSDFGDERQLLLQIRPGHRKVLKRNKKEYPKLSDHIGAFPLVIVSPQDYQLILGGATSVAASSTSSSPSRIASTWRHSHSTTASSSSAMCS